MLWFAAPHRDMQGVAKNRRRWQKQGRRIMIAPTDQKSFNTKNPPDFPPVGKYNFFQ
jgi:hypothetical protein